MTKPDTPRIALAHDWLVAHRGGEVVLGAIAEAVQRIGRPAGMYTMFALPPEQWRKPGHGGGDSALAAFGQPRTSTLNALPGGPDRLRRWLLPLYPLAVGELSRKLRRDHAAHAIDLIVSTSSAAIKGLRPPPGVPHLCYCHAPARYLWTQPEEYARGRAGGLRQLGLSVFGTRLRAWDLRTSTSRFVTRFLANSTHTAGEIRRCYGRDAAVVFPPVDTDFFTPDSADAAPGPRPWLYAGALEPYKRVDLAIEAANRSRHPLVIIGDGSQAGHLREKAGSTVRFLGRVDDSALRAHYRAAAMLLFPQIEDFGIVAAEAQACGTPVLAFRAGGALDTVVEGRTGAFFDRADPGDLIAAAARVPSPGASTAAACRANAERFSVQQFQRAINRELSELTRRRM